MEIKIFCFNVNGLRSLDKFICEKMKMTFNDWLLHLDYDIYCFQEIKGSEETLKKYFILEDFCAFASFHVKPNLHGVMTLVRKNGLVTKVEEIEKGRILLTDHGNFRVLNCYLPFLDENRYEEDELKIKIKEIMKIYRKVDEIVEKQNDIFICGDLNTTYNMSDNFLYQQELERLVYIDKVMDISNINKYDRELETKKNGREVFVEASAIKNTNQLIKVFEPDFYRKVCDLSENGIFTAKIKPKYAELPFYYLTVRNLYGRFMEKEQRKWLYSLLNKDVVDLYRVKHDGLFKYTCWDIQKSHRKINLGTRIDYILLKTQNDWNLISAEIEDEIFGSDHCPVSIEIEIDLEKIKSYKNLLVKPRTIKDFFKPNKNV